MDILDAPQEAVIMNKKHKMAVIGLDGATLNIIEMAGITGSDWLCSECISTIPPYTPPAWNSIITGVNPGKHGIIGFRKIDWANRKSTFYTSIDLQKPRIFEMLSLQGKKSIVANLPQTYPFKGIKNIQNIAVVSDWASPVQSIYPEKLNEKYKEYLIEPPTPSRAGKNITQYLKLVEEFLDARLHIYYDLLEKESWNLYFVVFSETDWIQHVVPEVVEGEKRPRVSKIFNKIKKFIQEAQNVSDITMLVSDHGFEIKEKIVYPNTVLKNAGLLKLADQKALALKLSRSAFRIATKIGPMRRFLKKHVGGKSGLLTVLDNDTKGAILESDTWGIYVFDSQYKEDIVRELEKLEELSHVYDAKELYKVQSLPKYFPEIIIYPRERVAVSTEVKDTPVKKIYKSEHSMRGIFCVTGEDVKKYTNFNSPVTVYDIAPTILHIFGLPIPNDVDGRVLMDILKEDSEFAKRKPKYADINYYLRSKEDVRVKKVVSTLKTTGKL